jgi:glucan phosphoethanolaminetransferase (alkaline phosphatase superfamily)
MLQRIQTLFLIISAIGMAAFLGTNAWKVINLDQTVIVNSFQVLETKGTLAATQKPIYYIAVMAVISIGTSIFAIFQYRNRVRQMLFVAFNSLIIGAAVAATVYNIKFVAMPLATGTVEGTFDIGIYAGFVALASNWLANRFIRKDEKLVQSAERMR